MLADVDDTMVIPSVYLSRSVQISSAHRLHSPLLSDDENRLLYGPCNNLNGHGHNYHVKVTLYGPVDPKTGMVMNLTKLKALMIDTIVDPLDHKHLDLDVAYFKANISTAENIVLFIWNGLKNILPNPALLYEVKVHETDKNTAYYRGD